MAKDTSEKKSEKKLEIEKETSEKKNAAKADKKADKKPEKKQPGKIRKWFKDLKVEFKKVVWPSKKTVVNNTSVVVGVIVMSAVVVGSLDEGFLALFRAIYH